MNGNDNKAIKTIKSLRELKYYFINFLKINIINKIIKNKNKNIIFKYKSKIKFQNCNIININNIFAFSLIELSIVLIIIGLLVAGITGGASLIESTKIKALSNEINSYKQAYFAFKALNGRAPGDLNGSGMIGYYSGQTYNSHSFPAPYNQNGGSGYGIPNEMSAPFVDLYLAKIIDFEPKRAADSLYGRYPDPARPHSKILTDCQYYFEYGKEDSQLDSHFKNNIKSGNIITIHGLEKINPKYTKVYDIKYDDGIYNNGSIRGNCGGNNSYDNYIINKTNCSSALTLIE